MLHPSCCCKLINSNEAIRSPHTFKYLQKPLVLTLLPTIPFWPRLAADFFYPFLPVHMPDCFQRSVMGMGLWFEIKFLLEGAAGLTVGDSTKEHLLSWVRAGKWPSRQRNFPLGLDCAAATSGQEKMELKCKAGGKGETKDDSHCRGRTNDSLPSFFFWKKSFLLMKEKENLCSTCSRRWTVLGWET